MTAPTATPRPKDSTYTCPLTFEELYNVAHALGSAITRVRQEMMDASKGRFDAMLWSELRDAAEALEQVTDHVCNDHRYWDGYQEEQATETTPT